MEKGVHSHPVQVAFLLDATCRSANISFRHRSLCLVLLRVLLSLSAFPNQVRMRCLKWKFVFLSKRESVIVKVPPFTDFNMSSIQGLFNELYSELQRNVDSQITTDSVSSALVDLIQGSAWDSPDILSPPKPKLGKTNEKNGQKWSTIVRAPTPLNFVFVCSHSQKEIEQLSSSFPSDLCTCLLKQNIKIFWMSESVHSNCKVMRNFVELTGGGVIKLSSLCDFIPSPTCMLSCIQSASVPSSKSMLQGTTVCSGNGSPRNCEFIFLCTKDDPFCIMQVEPLHKPTSDRGLIASISSSNPTPAKSIIGTGSIGTHAVIVGVLRQSDIPNSSVQATYSCIGLTIPSDMETWYQLRPDEQCSKTFSRVYQNLCRKLGQNRKVLLLEVKTGLGDVGLCVLQPLSSVVCSLSLLTPHFARVVVDVVSKHQPSDIDDLGIYRTYSHQPEEFAHDVMFSPYCIFPWYSYIQDHGVPISYLQDLDELQVTNGRDETSRRQTYGKLFKIVSSCSSYKDESEVFFQANHVDRSLNHDISQNTATLEEVIEMIHMSYIEQVQHGVEGLNLRQWTSTNLLKLQQKLKEKFLFSTVTKCFLLSPEQLEEKYDKEAHTEREKISEYQVQVLLRLELSHLCGSDLSEHDASILALQVTNLLRKISLLAKPAFLGHYMKEVIIPSYFSSCHTILLSVCEALMFSIPVELGGSPGMSSPILNLTSDDDSPASRSQHSLQRIMSAPWPISAKRSLVRCASFQDHRQITVPAQKAKVRKGEMKESDEETWKKDSSEAGINSKVPKKVCRTLFHRSLSLNTDTGFKRQHEEEESTVAPKKNKVDFLVKETPIKKQVKNYRQFKLQRLRSKMKVSSSEQVDVIEESPRRSFYSCNKTYYSIYLVHLHHFNPYLHPHGIHQAKLSVVSTVQESFKRKRPSSSSLKSLLQGRIDIQNSSNCNTAASTSNTSRTLFYENENPLTQEHQCFIAQSPTGHSCSSSTFASGLLSPRLEIEPLGSGGESASMVAFALCTPTKDDPINFENALN